MGKKAKQRKSQKAEQIGVKDFENLVRRTASLKKQGRSLAGEAGEMIKNAAEFKNLDRKAFAMFRSLNEMPTNKLATTLACLDYYIDIGKLQDRIDDQPQLEIGRPEAGEKQPKAKKAKSKKAKGDNVIDLPVVQAAE